MTNHKHIITDGRNLIIRSDYKEISSADFKNIEDIIDDQFCDDVANIKVASLVRNYNLPSEYTILPLRDLYAKIDTESMPEFRAAALSAWRKNNKYCGRCGAELLDSKNFTARECPNCKNLIFPRISPCIIIVVEKNNKILLAKHIQRNQDIYACIAGFIEAGESVEQAVEREVFEETGIKITNIKYRCSQSWPFPDQLMLGFTADYLSGEITLQPDEISDANWFDRNDLPASPKPGSVAYKLIHQLW